MVLVIASLAVIYRELQYSQRAAKTVLRRLLAVGLSFGKHSEALGTIFLVVPVISLNDLSTTGAISANFIGSRQVL